MADNKCPYGKRCFIDKCTKGAHPNEQCKSSEKECTIEGCPKRHARRFPPAPPTPPPEPVVPIPTPGVVKICTYYKETGSCKFGAGCRFSHEPVGKACSKCGEAGHVARDCPKHHPPPPPPPPPMAKGNVVIIFDGGNFFNAVPGSHANPQRVVAALRATIDFLKVAGRLAANTSMAPPRRTRISYAAM